MLPLGAQEWRFCRGVDCRDKDSIARLEDRFWARQWIERFKGDAALIHSMRGLLARERNTFDLFLMSDDGVIDAIADLLSCGRLHIHIQFGGAYHGDQRGRQHGQSAKSAPAPVPPKVQPPPVSVSPIHTDEPTFSPNLAVAAQVATLVGAAARGSAFCAT